MSENKPTEPRTVFSEHATPDRPGGHYGVRQPMEPDPAVPVPSGDRPSDAALTRELAQALASDGRLPDQRIEARASGGVVDLDGEVALEFQRTLAAGIARSVLVVLSVRNRLAVAEH